MTNSRLYPRSLIPQDRLPDVHAYMVGIVRNLKGKAIAIGRTANHAHLLIGLPSAIAPAAAGGKIKANLTGWGHGSFAHILMFDQRAEGPLRS